jgi:hypothetical protein
MLIACLYCENFYYVVIGFCLPSPVFFTESECREPDATAMKQSSGTPKYSKIVVGAKKRCFFAKVGVN